MTLPQVQAAATQLGEHHHIELADGGTCTWRADRL